jgi:hypothetical protein
MKIREAYTSLEDRYETIPVDYNKYKESVWRSCLIDIMTKERKLYGIEHD